MESCEVLKKLRLEKQPVIEKLLLPYFKKKGIKFEAWDGKLNNVILSYGGKSYKIAHEIFYRYHGMSMMLYEDKKNKMFKMIKMDDETFYNLIKIQILIALKIEYV